MPTSGSAAHTRSQMKSHDQSKRSGVTEAVTHLPKFATVRLTYRPVVAV